MISPDEMDRLLTPTAPKRSSKSKSPVAFDVGSFKQFRRDNGMLTGEEDRGVIDEIATGIGGGLVNEVPRMLGQAAKFVSPDGSFVHETAEGVVDSAEARAGQENWTLHPENHNGVTNALAEGGQMLAPSVAGTALAAGAIALAPVSLSAGGATLLAGALGAVPAALSQGQDTYESVFDETGDEEKAMAAGYKNMAIEWGGETIANTLALKFLGKASKAFRGKVAGNSAKDIIARIANPQALKSFGKDAAINAGADTVTEMGQAAGQRTVERNAGVAGASPWQSAKDVVAPSLGMNVLMLPIGGISHYRAHRQTRKLVENLQDGEAKVEDRLIAALWIDDQIRSVDPAAADNYMGHVASAIKNGEPIQVADQGLLDAFEVAKQKVADVETRTTAVRARENLTGQPPDWESIIAERAAAVAELHELVATMPEEERSLVVVPEAYAAEIVDEPLQLDEPGMTYDAEIIDEPPQLEEPDSVNDELVVAKRRITNLSARPKLSAKQKTILKEAEQKRDEIEGEQVDSHVKRSLAAVHDEEHPDYLDGLRYLSDLHRDIGFDAFSETLDRLDLDEEQSRGREFIREGIRKLVERREEAAKETGQPSEVAADNQSDGGLDILNDEVGVATDLDLEQQTFVDGKVQELGSVVAVDEFYGEDDAVGEYARAKAREVFVAATTVGEENGYADTHNVKVGDSVEVAGAASTVSSVKIINGVAYELYSLTGQDEGKGAARVYDLDSGNVVELKTFAKFDAAEEYSNRAILEAGKAQPDEGAKQAVEHVQLRSTVPVSKKEKTIDTAEQPVDSGDKHRDEQIDFGDPERARRQIDDMLPTYRESDNFKEFAKQAKRILNRVNDDVPSSLENLADSYGMEVGEYLQKSFELGSGHISQSDNPEQLGAVAKDKITDRLKLGEVRKETNDVVGSVGIKGSGKSGRVQADAVEKTGESEETSGVPAGRSGEDNAGSTGTGAVGTTGVGSSGDSAAEVREPDTGGGGDRGATSGSTSSSSGRNEQSDATSTGRAVRVDYRITESDQIGQGGAKTKFKGNTQAIRTLKQIQTEDRPATPEEQSILAKYVGWGGMAQAFPRPDGSIVKGWEKEVAELQELLTDEEYSSAMRSTPNAHYTSPEIIKGMFQGVQRLGVSGGRALEPSVGVGNFIGLRPDNMNLTFSGVELDNVTGEIAKLLYPKQNLHVRGFQDFDIAENSIDLAIGNPPFGSVTLHDSKHKDLKKFSIHNFFFAKSIKALRPGGVLAMVVSNSMMDKMGGDQRAWMAERTKLLGAIRLPNNAFKGNAGTEVTTDIIFLQKLAEGEVNNGEAWQEIDGHEVDGVTYQINEYFNRHPEMMIGRVSENKLRQQIEVVDGVYGGVSGLVLSPGMDFAESFSTAINHLPENVYRQDAEVVTTNETVAAPVEGVGYTPVDGFMVKAGQIFVRNKDVNGETRLGKGKKYLKSRDAYTDFTEKEIERFAAALKVRNALRDMIRAEVTDVASKELKRLRGLLNTSYDAFHGQYGYFHKLGNANLLGNDPDFPLLLSLEDNFSKGVTVVKARSLGVAAEKPSADKAAIFSRRIREPYRAPTRASSAKDALMISLNETGTVSLQRMGQLTGRSTDDLIAELHGSDVFQTPAGEVVSRDAYLSGDVKKKLAEAQVAAKTDAKYKVNVAELEKVQPAYVEAADIRVRLGSTWVPGRYYVDFLTDLLGEEGNNIKFNPQSGRWHISISHYDHTKNSTTWGTGRMGAHDLIPKVMQGQGVVVRDKLTDGSSMVNEEETALAVKKGEELSREFEEWIFKDADRRNFLEKYYNDNYNTHIEGNSDGSHLTFPGMSADISMRKHQQDAIWRGIQNGKILMDHVVGAGKTFAAIAIGVEQKRMGLIKKPLYVVPNHLVNQWAADFHKLYPGSNILALGSKDFTTKRRKTFLARIATGDYDAIIMAHSSFGFIKNDPKHEARMIRGEIREYEDFLQELKDDGDSKRTRKQVEDAKVKFEERLKAIMDREQDNLLHFGELGVDSLFIDEAHEFKNLRYFTKLQKISGLGDQAGSQKAAQLFTKTQYLAETYNGRGINFLTGTPISNTLGEMFTMQRYMMYDTLQEKGLQHFDSWINNFAAPTPDYELDPIGNSYKMTTRLREFVNIPEVMALYRSFADVVTLDFLKKNNVDKDGKSIPWPVPQIKGGEPQNIVVDRSPAQTNYMDYLVARYAKFPKDGKADNPLKATGDGRKMALDLRLIDPNAEDHEGSKLNEAVRQIERIHAANNHRKGAQLVFCDLSVPKKAQGKERQKIEGLFDKARKGDEAAAEALAKMSPDELSATMADFSVYDDIKAKLVRSGIPSNEIAFIHDANNDTQKEELFEKVRSGKIRILLGSTFKMGAGMNVQDRLVALHHLDCPWRPSDLEQREGRIIRQGNKFYAEDSQGFEIEIMRYATKQTVDARMWQVVEAKAGFIGQIRTADVGRVVEDVSAEAASFAEMKAAASGNPLVLEEVQLRKSIKDLRVDQRAHSRGQWRYQDLVRKADGIEALTRDRLRGIDEDIAKVEEGLKGHDSSEWTMTVAGKVHKPKLKKIVGNDKQKKKIETENKTATRDARKRAGEALRKQINAYVVAKTKGKDHVLDLEAIGEYAGFTIDANFFGVAKKGYGVQLTFDDASGLAKNITYLDKDISGGINSSGLLTRLDNALREVVDQGEHRKQRHEFDMKQILSGAEEAKKHIGQPFEQEQDIKDKENRHRDVLAELQADAKDQGKQEEKDFSRWIDLGGPVPSFVQMTEEDRVPVENGKTAAPKFSVSGSILTGDSGLGDAQVSPHVHSLPFIQNILDKEGLKEVNVNGGNVDAIRRIAKAFGKTVVFFREKGGQDGAGFQRSDGGAGSGAAARNDVAANAKRGRVQGFIRPSQPNRIYLNADSPSHVLFVLGHELGHTLRVEDEQLWKQMATELKPLIQNWSEYKERLKGPRYAKLSDTEIAEELFGDLIGENFLNEAFWQDMARQSPTLFARIARKAIDLLNRALRILTGRKVARYVTDMTQARAIIAKTLLEYGANVKSGKYPDHAVQYDNEYVSGRIDGAAILERLRKNGISDVVLEGLLSGINTEPEVKYALNPDNYPDVMDRMRRKLYVPERVREEAISGTEKRSRAWAAEAIARGSLGAIRQTREISRSTWPEGEYSQLAGQVLRPAEAKELEVWAEGNGLMLDNEQFNQAWEAFGKKGGTEHDVYHNKSDDRWYKRQRFTMSDTFTDYLQRIILTNKINNGTGEYRLEGFVKNDGELQPIVSQSNVVSAEKSLTVGEVNRFMQQLGAERVDKAGSEHMGQFKIEGQDYIISDHYNANIIRTEQGNIVFLDPMIKPDLNTKKDRIEASVLADKYGIDDVRFSIHMPSAEDLTRMVKHPKQTVGEGTKRLIRFVGKRTPEKLKATLGQIASAPWFASEGNPFRRMFVDLNLLRSDNRNGMIYDIARAQEDYAGSEGMRDAVKEMSTKERSKVNAVIKKGDVKHESYDDSTLKQCGFTPIMVAAYKAFHQTMKKANEVMMAKLKELSLIPYEKTDFYDELKLLVDADKSVKGAWDGLGFNPDLVGAYEGLMTTREALGRELAKKHGKNMWLDLAVGLLSSGATYNSVLKQYGLKHELMAIFKDGMELQRSRKTLEHYEGTSLHDQLVDFTLDEKKFVSYKEQYDENYDLAMAYKDIKGYNSELEKIKKELRGLVGYAPRIREDGDWLVRAYETDTETGEQVQVFMQTARTEHGAEKLEKRLEDDKAFLKESLKSNFREGVHYEFDHHQSEKLDEEIFLNLGSDMAINTLLNKAIDGSNGSIEELTTLRDSVLKLVANDILARGFGKHKIGRADHLIEGYRDDNYLKVVEQYVGGMAGWLSKSEFAIRAQQGLRDSDSAKPEDKRWVQVYVNDALRNTSYLDQIGGTVRSYAALMYLGGKISTALLNSTQNYVVGQAELSRHGAKNPMMRILKAQKDIIALHAGKTSLNAEEMEILQEASRTGRTKAQYVREVFGQDEGIPEKGVSGVVSWLAGKSMIPFQAVETYWNREPMLLAAFREFRKQGLDKDAAMKKAGEVVNNTHFVIGKENRPEMVRKMGAVGTTAYTFQSYTHNYLLWLANRIKAGEIDAIGRSMTALALLGGLAALPGVGDLDDWWLKLFGESPQADLKKWLRENGDEYLGAGEALEGFVIHGIPSVARVNFSRSLGVQIPFMGAEEESFAERFGGVWPGLWKRTGNSLDSLSKGDYLRALENAPFTPEFVANPMRALRYRQGAKTLSGKPITDEHGEQLTYDGYETFLKSLGLNPLRVSKRHEAKGQAFRLQEYWGEAKSDLVAAYRLAKDDRERKAVKREINKFNTKLLSGQAQKLLAPIEGKQLRRTRDHRYNKRQADFMDDYLNG